MENGNMNSTSGNVHMEGGAAPETSMLLRERIKRLMGNGVHASWKSLPEVKSSGLLQMLTETQIELEELKFCLITCEVAYNTELTELLNLSKRSVSWADPLPTFNRRTIASSVERVKRSSDAFLNAFEKQWNMKPVVNLTILNKTFTDMSLQFQNYITYCTQQEDLRVTLCTAKRSKYEVAVASFSNRLNIERVMLPLQHLKLYHLLFQDIHSKLTSTTNRLDIFHCKRILSDITKLLDECYKALRTLHGSKYIKEIDRIVDESLHSFESEPAQSNVPKHQENIVTDAATFRSKQSSVSVHDTDSKCSELCTVQEVNQNRFSTVRERCKFFDLKSVESYSKDTVKRKDNVTFKRQKPLQDCKRKVTDTPLNLRSSQIISERRTVFEVGEANILCKRNSYPTKSKIPVSHL
ncbi:rho guanine nucleotide exchange factor 19-like [Zootermopsis nevadensis]|uniref:rho guanine nucleotide exchange factor 19-like n=1 Tax=Zootermopsis nevadensis TaxID=136037 RepID=UPI000B8EE3E2|nr:rho guanine nucleotide exchange factor 19-like [Zootermopsis nevadensis]